ncbi:DUF3105 domain-containing protein [Pseudarthrobacter cellobiosi]|uniref:DUF3105 domain-containing protein n=1 Tax=Pseudarthrobacter cellobiosi TaxID=2953654 RepID=UPI00208F04D8|nr:DUF3105 domain-containing protein [Pseudarthrobacter sp. HLT1-5]MCO4254477.1 DUF3105 domain-containing protein [Pseudarthrobacter sp. HLT1-5]
MGRARNQQDTERKAILAAVRAKQQRQERRKAFRIYGTAAVVLLALAGTVTSVIVVDQQNKAQTKAEASKPIDGLLSVDGLSRNHTASQTPYPRTPPVGGDHAPQFLNCGTYTSPVNPWQAVHSLEHGAVWVTYRPDLPKEQIDALTKQAAANRYELLSPFPDLPSPVVASAWGKQLQVDSAEDPRLPVFLKAHLQGPQTPEPGAPCSGGIQG